MSNRIDRLQHTILNESTFTYSTQVNEHKDVIVEWLGEGQCKVRVHLAQDSSLKLFYLNQASKIQLDESYILDRNARLVLSYADFNDAPLTRSSEVILNEEGSSVHLKSALLVESPKELSYKFTHVAPHTSGDMENFAVTMNEGSMNLRAIGHIQKTAGQSETHQSTRVLNYNSVQRAGVFPQLIIDNNDVKASHAQSSGQIDPDHLYYLQSRGLSSKEAIRLIIQGYLSSILETIDDEDVQNQLRATIDQKVDKVCSI